ncbi:MAG: cell division protein FtsL [Candidatus Methylomirabilis sp.]|nr:cell division protein FtsL [Deltaproteobacteria bacterium]
MAEVVSKKLEFPGVLLGQDVKAKRDPRDLNFIYFAVAASLAAMLIIFGFVWSRLMVVNAGYGISKANSTRAALIEQNKRLKLEYVRLKSPERIEGIAAEMGFENPKSGQIIVLR